MDTTKFPLSFNPRRHQPDQAMARDKLSPNLILFATISFYVFWCSSTRVRFKGSLCNDKLLLESVHFSLQPDAFSVFFYLYRKTQKNAPLKPPCKAILCKLKKFLSHIGVPTFDALICLNFLCNSSSLPFKGDLSSGRRRREKFLILFDYDRKQISCLLINRRI